MLLAQVTVIGVITMVGIEGLLNLLTPAVTTLFSVSFLSITFLLGQYENNKLEAESEWKPYYYGYWIMVVSLLFSAISLFSAIATQLLQYKCMLVSMSLFSLIIAVLSILFGVAFLSYQLPKPNR